MARNYKTTKQAVIRNKPSNKRRFNFTILKWMGAGAILTISAMIIVPRLPIANVTNQMKNLSLAGPLHTRKETLPPKRDITVQTTKPSFDFYTLLPEMKVDVPTKPEPVVAIAVAPAPAKPVQAPVVVAKAPAQPQLTPPKPNTVLSKKYAGYSLQIASFKNFSDADAAKTQLLVSGFPVRLQTSTSSTGQTLHRIKMGPYKNKDFAQKDRQRLLAKNYTQTIVISEE